MVCAIILLLHDFLGKETTFVNLYCHGGLLVVSVYYLLYLAKKRQPLSDGLAGKSFMPLRWFVIMATSSLLLSFFLLYGIEGDPIWITALSLGITALFLLAVYVAVQRVGRLR
jgi:lipid-A-disaccharide synthase-like uncharacterized protein